LNYFSATVKDEYKVTAFTFQEKEGAIEVKDWEEIRKKLK